MCQKPEGACGIKTCRLGSNAHDWSGDVKREKKVPEFGDTGKEIVFIRN